MCSEHTEESFVTSILPSSISHCNDKYWLHGVIQVSKD